MADYFNGRYSGKGKEQDTPGGSGCSLFSLFFSFYQSLFQTNVAPTNYLNL